MKVYHGSYIEIFEIDLYQSVINRDFGKGFYVTKLREQAEYWAKRKGRQHKTKGVVTEFQFSEVAFTSYGMNVLRFTDYTEQWLDFVVMNRTAEAPENIHDYDIVEGPVANDDIAARITLYLENKITKAEFLEELKFKHALSHQIALCTQKALQMIKKSFTEIDFNEMTIDDAIVQSLVLDFEMEDFQAIDTYFNSETYSNLIDENTDFYKKSWQEIYEMLKIELTLKQHL